MIKKFENFENTRPSVKFPHSANDRFQANIDIFEMALENLKKILEENFANKSEANWGDVGSLSHINEELVNIIEGYDEEMADKLRALMNPPAPRQ